MTDRQANSMPEMGITEIVENLKTMIFGEQAFKRFNTDERHILYEAIYALQSLQAISLDLAFENDELEEKLAQEPTTKNDLGVDCISREEAIKTIQRYGVGCFDADEFSPEECERFVIGKLNELDSVTPKGVTVTDFADKCRECGKQKKSEHDKNVVLEKLRAEITTLQNRCYALTKGTMCAFCKYKCEYKAESEGV